MGLVGGIGSGKSALAAWAAQHLRCTVIDGDEAGHRALEQADVKQQIRKRFGAEVFDSENNIRRERLARTVFGPDETHHRARRDLEQIVHPVIRGELQQQVAAARQAGAADVILLDAAVLLDAGWNDVCNAIVFIDAPLEHRRARASARGWDAGELERRESHQLPLTEKRAASDFIVDNSGSLEDAGRRFLEILNQIARTSEN